MSLYEEYEHTAPKSTDDVYGPKGVVCSTLHSVGAFYRPEDKLQKINVFFSHNTDKLACVCGIETEITDDVKLMQGEESEYADRFNFTDVEIVALKFFFDSKKRCRKIWFISKDDTYRTTYNRRQYNSVLNFRLPARQESDKLQTKDLIIFTGTKRISYGDPKYSHYELFEEDIIDAHVKQILITIEQDTLQFDVDVVMGALFVRQRFVFDVELMHPDSDEDYIGSDESWWSE